VAWDASRPVPWQQLTRSWLIYVAVMSVVFIVLFRDRSLVGVFAGLLVSGPLYLAFGAILAKFGYQRKTWSELRAERSERGTARSSEVSQHADSRPRPAPTKRTGGGAQRPGGSRKRRR
jgi:hypothetical protein